MQGFKVYIRNSMKVIAFFAVLALVFIAVSVKTEKALLENDRLVPVRNKNIYRIQREPENTIDVLILGDSLSYSAISPMRLWKEYGVTSFVCGQPAQKMRESEEMLRTALKTQKPKLVIIETDTMFREQIRLKNLNDYIDSLLNYLVPVFRGHDAWKSLIMEKEYIEENYKGFAFRCRVKPYTKGDYMTITQRKEKIPNMTLTHMGRIMEICRENGAKLMLLSTPSPVNYTYARHNAIAGYAKEQSLTYVDLNLHLEELGIDWQTDSLDQGDHLNLSGAEKVTRYLGQYLSENYSLQDHRGDPDYASWEEESASYEKKMKKNLVKIRGE